MGRAPDVQRSVNVPVVTHRCGMEYFRRLSQSSAVAPIAEEGDAADAGAHRAQLALQGEALLKALAAMHCRLLQHRKLGDCSPQDLQHDTVRTASASSYSPAAAGQPQMGHLPGSLRRRCC